MGVQPRTRRERRLILRLQTRPGTSDRQTLFLQLLLATPTSPSSHLSTYWDWKNTTRMPEVDKQTSLAQDGESLEKPGGLSFEVVLEEAKTTEAPKLECPPTPTPSVEEIEKRLKEAEERRKSMEASTLEKLAQEEKKREEVRAKKAELAESPAEGCEGEEA